MKSLRLITQLSMTHQWTWLRLSLLGNFSLQPTIRIKVLQIFSRLIKINTHLRRLFWMKMPLIDRGFKLIILTMFQYLLRFWIKRSCSQMKKTCKLNLMRYGVRYSWNKIRFKMISKISWSKLLKSALNWNLKKLPKLSSYTKTVMNRKFSNETKNWRK
jgi:hypothetical protein